MTDRHVARTVHSLALLLAAIGLLAESQAAESSAKPSEQLPASGAAVVGEKAPWLAGWTLEESVFNIDKPFADPTVERLVLVFWATYCQPCRVGMQRLQDAAADLTAAGVRVALINVGESAALVSAYFGEHRPSFDVVLDPYLNSEEAYLLRPDGRKVLPLTVVLDRSRAVVRMIGAEGDDYVRLLVDGVR